MARRTLPPLHALRGFEAAARLLSFSAAAEELGVTQGAVSRQVRALEDWLGRPVFHRMTRRVALTEAGQAMARLAEDAFGLLEDGAARLRGAGPQRLVLGALPTITSAWLMPRLDRFAKRHPELELRLLSSIAPAALAPGELDVAIRVGPLPGRRYPARAPRIELQMVASWAGLVAEPLFPDVLVPVCRAELLPGGAPVTAAELAGMPLLHTSTRRHAWPDWLRAQGAWGGAMLPGQPSFGHFFMALEAARRGQGVALVPDVLLPAAGLPMPGALVTASTARIASAGEYFFLFPASRAQEAGIAALRGWLLEEAAQTRLDIRCIAN
ncbi:LysR substrate-binding domain-containing protein [Roseomonas sp. 18066]|uniref:LysR substrate-binding domain-containing protein n=1 Tax=Roseomonas sp. 18066 TaxID=2681412 RepID=UPI00135A68F4|nr:LysR substrate-binding domain-containing protein [Roseomonas sp. 18066]